jgi:hypothetical protein
LGGSFLESQTKAYESEPLGQPVIPEKLLKTQSRANDVRQLKPSKVPSGFPNIPQ